MENNKITMKAKDARDNYNKIMIELKKYVNEETVLNLDKRRIVTKIRQLFDKYPTTLKKKFDTEWYDYQLKISLILMSKIKTNKFVKNNILKLKDILPNFNSYKGLYEDMKKEIKLCK